MPQKLTLHHMWGGCPHVTGVQGTIVPATMTPATVTLHQGNGYTVQYKNPLFGNIQEQEFGKGGTSGYNKGAGNFSGGYTS